MTLPVPREKRTAIHARVQETAGFVPETAVPVQKNGALEPEAAHNNEYLYHDFKSPTPGNGYVRAENRYALTVFRYRGTPLHVRSRT